MAALVAAIHKHRPSGSVWMAGTSPAMTGFYSVLKDDNDANAL
jgi:hypothetical protein